MFSFSFAQDINNNMVLVNAGSFIMGSDNRKYAESDEYYPHKVNLDAFYVSRYEATIKEVVSAFNYALKKKQIYVTGNTVYLSSNDKVICEVNTGKNTKTVKYENGQFLHDEDAANYPVVYMSWFGAAACCNFLSEMAGLERCYDEFMSECDFSKNGYRLPTEAEWEYAARSGGKDYLFSWGNDTKKPKENIADLSFKKAHKNLPCWDNYRDNYVYTSPVGTFPANELGLHDISGNVGEWVWDFESPSYSKDEVSNPKGPETGTHKMMRGGTWYDTMQKLRLTDRYWGDPQNTATMATSGFRFAKSK